jgi:hypothetical protein
MGLFKTIDTSGIVMALQVKDFLSPYNLLAKLIAYVKYKGGNLSTLHKFLL